MNAYLIKKIVLQMLAIVALSLFVGLLVNAFRADGIRLIGEYSLKDKGSVDYRGVKNISPEEAEEFHRASGAVFVDARSQWEYDEGHIPGAVSMPADDVGTRLGAFCKMVPRNSVIITYCDGEFCHLSSDLAIRIEKEGYGNVMVLVDGWGVWQRRGHAIEKTVISERAGQRGTQ